VIAVEGDEIILSEKTNDDWQNISHLCKKQLSLSFSKRRRISKNLDYDS
jgi:hypothetical protein